ncbi:type 1 glutamine amidotransferase [Flavobacterium sp.]|uniref:type 1 glutamine amidotransferase n=1 Tax=Flavobacterium sp. TaxID=239 RepID=UPI0039E33298
MEPIRIHVLQHVAFEEPGCIQTWADQNRHPLSVTRLFEDHTLPKPDDFDWLIVLGGPMSVNETDVYPWLDPEKRLLKKTIDSGKTVIGICLGAQLIASALGYAVYRNKETEIGWFPIQAESDSLLFNGTKSFTAFHWHGETFDLPASAQWLASSDACTNQAFAMDRVLGLQFHLEATVDTVSKMVTFGQHELVPGNYIQSAAEILEKTELLEANNERMYRILDHLATGKHVHF